MQILKPLIFYEMRGPSDACILVERDLSADVVQGLLFAQQVSEGMLLDGFPVYVIPLQTVESEYVWLYENVYRVPITGWDVVDSVECFLVNERMFDLCKSDSGSFIRLQFCMSDELRVLAEKAKFWVVGVKVYG